MQQDLTFKVTRIATARENLMDYVMDFIYIALIAAFFVATAGLIRFCARLMDTRGKS
jgi:hypothetical protein